MHDLIQKGLQPLMLQVEELHGKLLYELKAEHPIVMGDPSHLLNTIRNLVDNAIKYSKGSPEISIKSFNVDHDLVLQISDKGIGIEKNYQKKIFDKFYRVPTGDIHDVKGFGLGLAYTKKIIELHDGTIELESEKGKGSIFTITLRYV
jgi:two-component system phosphate regulon sensor histidine kinase PhoR